MHECTDIWTRGHDSCRMPWRHAEATCGARFTKETKETLVWQNTSVRLPAPNVPITSLSTELRAPGTIISFRAASRCSCQCCSCQRCSRCCTRCSNRCSSHSSQSVSQSLSTTVTTDTWWTEDGDVRDCVWKLLLRRANHVQPHRLRAEPLRNRVHPAWHLCFYRF